MDQEMEIICVGNELLIGKTLNTNAQWLARRATTLGVYVKRIIVVGDYVDEIASTVNEALRRKPRFVITTGGLGPTFDDRTLRGLAKALNRAMTLDETALQMIKKKYEMYVEEGKIEKAELTPPRIKMATLPEGAESLPNSVGTAPGIKIMANETLMVALPGVPNEMEAIFNESVAILLRSRVGRVVFLEDSLYSHRIVESALAPLIDKTMNANPYVYVKSHPKGPNIGIDIHFSTSAKDYENAESRLKNAMAQLADLIKDEGGKVDHQKE